MNPGRTGRFVGRRGLAARRPARLLLFVALGVLGGPALAAPPAPPSAPSAACQAATAADYPFAAPESLARDLCHTLPPPPGFVRVPAVPGSFAAWLRHLPLRPAGTPVVTYDGAATLWPQALVAAVVDLDVMGKVQDCATTAVRLRAEYLLAAGKSEALAVEMNQRQRLTFPRFQAGCRPLYDRATKRLSIGCGGGRRAAPTSPAARSEAARAFVRAVMTWANSSTLHRTLPAVVPDAVAAGDVLAQPNPTGGVGHASIVLDEARGPAGERRYLVGMGFLPAQNLQVVRPLGTPADAAPWCTLDEFGAYLSFMGPIAAHRFE